MQLFLSQYVLEEVLVSAVRVKANVPVTHSNLSKKEIAKRNLGQDIPILLNYLPSVVTSQMLALVLVTRILVFVVLMELE